MTDVDVLCSDLEIHIVRLYQHLPPGSAGEQAGSHAKPSSRPALSIPIHDLIAEIVTGIVDHEHRARRHLGDVTRADNVGAALHALPHLATRLPETLLGQLLRDLDSYVKEARTALGLNRRLQTLGPCPIVQTEPLAVGYNLNGEAGAALDSTDCMAFDMRATRKATKAARAINPDSTQLIEVYSRAHLLADLDADRRSTAGDVWCPGCGARWSAAEWPRLAMLMQPEEEAASA